MSNLRFGAHKPANAVQQQYFNQVKGPDGHLKGKDAAPDDRPGTETAAARPKPARRETHIRPTTGRAARVANSPCPEVFSTALRPHGVTRQRRMRHLVWSPRSTACFRQTPIVHHNLLNLFSTLITHLKN